jgi:RNA polymerase sigma factor (sigma-70 family)
MNSVSASTGDASIIRASLDEPAAFALLFDRHAAMIWRYARRRAGTTVVDEVVGETFLRAFAGREAYDLSQRDARPWLYGIATNVLRGHARQEERRHRAYARAAERDGVDGGLDRAEARADAARRAPVIATALARLDPTERDTLLLFALTDLGYEGIAVAMDAPIGTVRSRLHRARRRMRIELALEGALAPASAKNERDQP